MPNGSNKKIKRDGYKLNSNKKIVPDDLYYADPDHHNELHARGCPIDVDVAEKMIGRYWNGLKKEQPADYLQKHVAFVVGKESLLSILSQKDCVAVRFYIARWAPDMYEGNLPDIQRTAGETIIAVGVKQAKDSDKPDVWDIGGKNENRLIVTPITDNWDENNIMRCDNNNGEIREMVPPFTIKELKEMANRKETNELATIVNSYFP